MRKETLITLSRRTGFSVSTVSRVLNGKANKYRISEKTVKLITEEANSRNYKPSLLAKGLRTQKTNTIGLLVPGIDNPYFANIASTVISETSRLGYTTVFWSLAYADWDNNKQLAPERALELVLSRTHNGCVALLHPTSSTNAAILGRYIDTLRAQGYTFGSLNELVNSETPEKTGKGEENHEKKDPVMGTESNT